MHSYIRRVVGICRVGEIRPQSRDLAVAETPKNRSSRDFKLRYSALLVGSFDVFFVIRSAYRSLTILRCISIRFTALCGFEGYLAPDRFRERQLLKSFGYRQGLHPNVYPVASDNTLGNCGWKDVHNLPDRLPFVCSKSRRKLRYGLEMFSIGKVRLCSALTNSRFRLQPTN
jgi:hypothetical protein